MEESTSFPAGMTILVKERLWLVPPLEMRLTENGLDRVVPSDWRDNLESQLDQNEVKLGSYFVTKKGEA